MEIFKTRWIEAGEPKKRLLLLKLVNPILASGNRKKIMVIKNRLRTNASNSNIFKMKKIGGTETLIVKFKNFFKNFRHFITGINGF